MNKSGKKWGFTSQLFNKNNVEIHRIVGDIGGTTSMHMHDAKYSMLFVESGQLKIYVEKNDYNLTDITILNPGESTILNPKEFHKFEVMADQTVCYEIYWVQINENDIIRRKDS